MSVTRGELLRYVNEQAHIRNTSPIFEIMLTTEIKPYVNKNGEETDWPDLGLNNMGFYYDLDEAIDAMNTNALDIQEHCFYFGFIAARFPGVYNNSAHTWARIFFKWDDDREGFFEETNEPDVMKHVGI